MKMRKSEIWLRQRKRDVYKVAVAEMIVTCVFLISITEGYILHTVFMLCCYMFTQKNTASIL